DGALGVHRPVRVVRGGGDALCGAAARAPNRAGRLGRQGHRDFLRRDRGGAPLDLGRGSILTGTGRTGRQETPAPDPRDPLRSPRSGTVTGQETAQVELSSSFAVLRGGL